MLRFMPLAADGRYDRDAPGAPPPPYSPGELHEERLCDLALWSAYTAPADGLRSEPPDVPRFGYDRTPLTISDVLGSFDRRAQGRLDFSGQTGGYSGTSTPSLGQ